MSKFDLNDERVVCIVGSGPGGATIAERLCAAGINCVLFEAGAYIGPKDYLRDEWSGFDQLAWKEPRIAAGSWRLGQDHPESPVWHSRAVGGTSTQWMGVCLRLKPWEFRPRETYGEVAGADLIDWPLTEADLTPWYDQAEQRMRIAGMNGTPLHPPSRHWRIFERGATRAGYRQVSRSRMAILTEAWRGRGACPQDGFALHGDRSRAKWSTTYVDIPDAEATGHLDLRSNCRVVELEVDRAGRIAAVIYVDAAGIRRRQLCAFAVVAGNSVESPRLLLASQSARFPRGLANGSDMVGRCYMRHVMGSVWSVFDEPVYMNRGEAMPGLVEDELPHDPARGFVGGYYLQLNAISLPAMASALEPALWGRSLTGTLEHYARMAGVIMMGEDLPQKSNRITLDDSRTDAFGVPLARVHSDEHPNDTRMRNHAYLAMRRMHQLAGAVQSHETPPFPSTHNLGTLRMSADPAEGVTNRDGVAHEVDNLMVAGGPLFTGSAAANPTLTIVALALRQADQLIARLT